MEKMLPMSIEAELGVLGSLVIDPDAIVGIADQLRPDDFYREAHRAIYETILRLYHVRQEPADYITLCDELERHGKLSQVGGASYIGGLVNEVPTAGNVDYYARIVKQKAECRRVIGAAGTIAAIGYEETENVLERAEAALYRLSEGTVSSDLVGLSNVMQGFLNRLDARSRETGKIVGLPTHFFDLDFKLGGLQPQELIILGGRPGEGKTSLLLNIVHNLLFKSQVTIAVFSLEMSQDDLARRLISMETGIDSQRLRTRFLSEAEWDKIVNAADRLSDDHVCIDESGELSITALRSKCRRHKAKYGLDLVVVDYLQLMSSEVDEKRQEDRRHQIDKISRGLKQLARELDVPVLACASLNRAVEGRADQTPKLSDLRESGSIESDADVVMFIRRSRETEGVSLINIEKHRNGPTGEVKLKFDASLTKFSDMEGTSDE